MTTSGWENVTRDTLLMDLHSPATFANLSTSQLLNVLYLLGRTNFNRRVLELLSGTTNSPFWPPEQLVWGPWLALSKARFMSDVSFTISGTPTKQFSPTVRSQERNEHQPLISIATKDMTSYHITSQPIASPLPMQYGSTTSQHQNNTTRRNG